MICPPPPPTRLAYAFFFLRPGHFTQVVWKNSKELGVGRAQGKDGKWIVVCNYSPAGNFVGRDAENVFPAGGGKSAAASPARKCYTIFCLVTS